MREGENRISGRTNSGDSVRGLGSDEEFTDDDNRGTEDIAGGSGLVVMVAISWERLLSSSMQSVSEFLSELERPKRILQPQVV